MADIHARRPDTNEFAPYLAGYVGAVPDGDVLAHLEAQRARSVALFCELTDAQAGHSYAVDKWNVRELLGHVIDTERVFQYRALSFARGDSGPLPGFDQDDWMAAAGFGERSMAGLVQEYETTRRATCSLFASFDAARLDARGVASGYALTVRGILFTVAGHELHHMAVLAEKYGIG